MLTRFECEQTQLSELADDPNHYRRHGGKDQQRQPDELSNHSVVVLKRPRCRHARPHRLHGEDEYGLREQIRACRATHPVNGLGRWDLVVLGLPKAEPCNAVASLLVGYLRGSLYDYSEPLPCQSDSAYGLNHLR